MPLTDVKIRQAKPRERAYRIADSAGLCIEIKPNGSKLWRYRYRIAGKQNDYAIGPYPTTSLGDARKAAQEAAELVEQGLHPAHVRKSKRLNSVVENQDTMKQLCVDFLEQRRKKWTERYIYQFERAFRQNVYPVIGKLPPKQVTSAHILDIMKRMDKRGATTYALQVRQWLSSVFRYGVSTLRIDTDPAQPLTGAFQRPQVKHAEAIDKDGITDYLTRLKGFGGYRATGIALELILLLFVRTVELRRAEWSEFDLEKGLWTIPGEKMKKRREHIIPLPNQALTLLKELQSITGAGRYLFPNTRRPTDIMSATTINRALEYLGYPTGKVTGHDFRATASTRLNEMGYNPDHIELQLAHVDKSASRRAYNHALHLDERRQMMQDWANWIDSLRKEPQAL